MNQAISPYVGGMRAHLDHEDAPYIHARMGITANTIARHAATLAWHHEGDVALKWTTLHGAAIALRDFQDTALRNGPHADLQPLDSWPHRQLMSRVQDAMHAAISATPVPKLRSPEGLVGAGHGLPPVLGEVPPGLPQ
jgi:hypothetical protein